MTDMEQSTQSLSRRPYKGWSFDSSNGQNYASSIIWCFANKKNPLRVDFNALFTHCLLKGDNINTGYTPKANHPLDGWSGFKESGSCSYLRKRTRFLCYKERTYIWNRQLCDNFRKTNAFFLCWGKVLKR